ncbi:N-acetylmuramoyl-L-alanine amidase [Flavobacteriaceae bacterium AH-315-B10]|nr:N-acetylmuramoyl-L-alanine amidase [Flavobacteriaceae bacterium AH-315-B10]
MQTYIKYFLLSFIFLLTSNNFAQKTTKKFVVVLDAGHGGKDPGNLGNGFKEKDIALSIVLKIGTSLEKHKDIKVIYTRKTDVLVDLHERGAIANRADADLFVSIHCNSWHTQKPYGTETFVLGTKRSETNFNVAKMENEVIFLEEDHEKNYQGFDPNNPESLIGITLMMEDYLDQSILLATYIQDNFTNKLKRRNRGVKQEGFIVLHQTYMPSVLVETGFLSYKKEGLYLNSKKGQTEMATAIRDAILKYKNNLNLSFDESVVVNSSSDTNEPLAEYPEITFKVQIAASSRKLKTKPYNFKGLNEVSRKKTGKTFKYFYGATSNYSKIKEQKKEALKKGYDTCFIVAFRNGEKISLDQALKTPSN